MGKGKRMKEDKKSMKSGNKKTPLLFKLITLAYLVITIIFFVSIIKMNMLPGKYVLIFSLVELILTILVTLGLWKPKKLCKTNVICTIIAIILSVVYIFATNYANVTMKFLKNMVKEALETEEYYVVVQKNSQYNKPIDLKGKEILMFKIEEDVKKDIIDKAKATLVEKESLSEVGSNLIEGYADAIAVSSSQYDMLDEEIKDFKANTKIIHTSTHVIKTASIDDTQSKYNVEGKAFNIYITGIDTSGNISNVARSDANIIATVNLNTHEILLTSIPRDYYVTLHRYGAKDKLTHSGIYGVNETVTTVEDLLDIDINYYVRVNFTTVIKLVDELGGIEVNSDYAFTTNGTHYSFKKGINYLDGEEALAFSRERYSFEDGDNQRVKNQQKVISAIIDKVTSSTTILTKYTSILNALEGSFQTNIGQDELSKIVKDQLNTMPSWTIKSNSLTGTGDYASTYSMGSQELYVMRPDETSVKTATQKINEVLGK